MKIKINYIYIGIIILIVLFSLIFPGYKTLTSDQEIYLPQISNMEDEVLQETDFLYSFNQVNYTVFDEFIGVFIHDLNINIFIVLFILTITVRFIYFFSIYRIAYYFTKNRRFSLLSPLIFISGLTVFGTALNTIDIELHPRTFAFSLLLLFLALYFDKKKYAAGFCLGLGILVHPISAIPFILFFYLDLLITFFKDKELKIGKLIGLGAIPVVVGSILLLFIDFSGDSYLLALIDSGWEHIIRFRDNYVYLTSWPKKEFIYFLIAVIFFLVSILELKDILKGERKKYFYMLLAIPLALSGIFFIFTEFANLFASFQLYRSLIVWKIILPILFAFYAYRKITQEKPDYLYSFIVMGMIFAMVIKELSILVFIPVFMIIWLKKYMPRWLGFINQITVLAALQIILIGAYFYYEGIMQKDSILEFAFILGLAFSSVLLPFYFRTKKLFFAVPFVLVLGLFIALLSNPAFRIKPEIAYENNFDELCSWIIMNTDKDDVFITEPYSKDSAEVRVLCKRAVYFSDRDGAQVVFDKTYAEEWDRRRNLLKKKNLDTLTKLAREENIKYLIATKDVVSLNNDIVFDNDKYIIYKIN